MFWKKLILLNLVVLYLALKVFLLISSELKKKERQLDLHNEVKRYLNANYTNLNCNITNVFEINEKLVNKFDQLRSTLFFKIFKVNFDSNCNFWTQNMICNFHTCTVCQCDDNEIPLPWMQDSENDDVDKRIDEKFHKWVEKYNYSSPNWIVENEIDSKIGIFVNLEKNLEAFTGYQGQHIWNAIYYENCFRSMTPDQMCKEEKTLYKIISGLHTNINIHLSRNYFDLNKNLSYFNYSMLDERVLKHPERMNNLFFLYSILFKAFYKSEKIIANYNYYTGNTTEDNKIKKILENIFSVNNNICDDCLSKEFFLDEKSQDKFLNFNPFKLDELKLRFRNISQIIDCVSCQKCKLHGKLQIYGLATMLKILFAPTNKEISLKRNELISFINLVGKVSRSIHYLKEGIIKKVENSIKDDKKLNFELFLVYMIPVAFFVFMMNRYFLKNKQLLGRKLIKNRNDPNQNDTGHQSDKLAKHNEKVSKKNEAELIKYLNSIKRNEEFIISNEKKHH